MDKIDHFIQGDHGPLSRRGEAASVFGMKGGRNHFSVTVRNDNGDASEEDMKRIYAAVKTAVYGLYPVTTEIFGE